MNYEITIQVFLLNISGKNIHFGVTAIFVCSIGEANPDKNILRAKVDDIHPID